MLNNRFTILAAIEENEICDKHKNKKKEEIFKISYIKKKTSFTDIPHDVLKLISILIIDTDPESFISLMSTCKKYLHLLDSSTYYNLVESLVHYTKEINGDKNKYICPFKKRCKKGRRYTYIPSYKYLRIFDSSHWINRISMCNERDKLINLINTNWLYCISHDYLLELLIDALITNNQIVAEFIVSITPSSLNFRNVVSILKKRYHDPSKHENWQTGNEKFDTFLIWCFENDDSEDEYRLKNKILKSNVKITMLHGLIILSLILSTNRIYLTRITNTIINSKCAVDTVYYYSTDYQNDRDILFSTTEEIYNHDDDDSDFEDYCLTSFHSFGSLREFVDKNCCYKNCADAVNSYIEKFCPKKKNTLDS